MSDRLSVCEVLKQRGLNDIEVSVGVGNDCAGGLILRVADMGEGYFLDAALLIFRRHRRDGEQCRRQAGCYRSGVEQGRSRSPGLFFGNLGWQQDGETETQARWILFWRCQAIPP
jgi:hypothetical protein